MDTLQNIVNIGLPKNVYVSPTVIKVLVAQVCSVAWHSVSSHFNSLLVKITGCPNELTLKGFTLITDLDWFDRPLQTFLP